MNLCSHNHDEVCFESRKCPLCEKMDDFAKYERNAEKEIESLKSEVSSLEAQLNEPLVHAAHQVAATE